LETASHIATSELVTL